MAGCVNFLVNKITIKAQIGTKWLKIQDLFLGGLQHLLSLYLADQIRKKHFFDS